MQESVPWVFKAALWYSSEDINLVDATDIHGEDWE